MSDDSLHDSIARRSFLKGAGVAGTAVATALSGALPAPAQAQTPPPAKDASPQQPPAPEPLLTLTATEAAFLSAAYDTFIPADRLSPSGTDCGLVTYIDRQLAGAWGGGAQALSQRPLHQGHAASRAISSRSRRANSSPPASRRRTHGRARPTARTSTASSPAERDAALKTMDAGKAEFDEINGKQFFEMLLHPPWRASSPIRSTAAIATRSPGAWSAIRACPRPMPARRWNIAARRSTLEPQSIADFS